MTSNDRNLVTSKGPGTVLLMQNVLLGQTKVMQIRQRETQIRQRETTYEICCLAAQRNFSEIANPLGFSPQPARPLCFLHASLHYSAGSLASLILPKKVQNLTPREVSTAMYRLY